jgi:hypothetical protein
MHKSAKWTIVLLLGAVALLVACRASETPTPCSMVECPACPPEVMCPECPEVMCPECPEVTCPECPEVECPEPTVIAETPYYEMLWASSAHSAAAITCISCHDESATLMTSVTFPSGLEVTGLGDEARCMQCHEGRTSTKSVDDATGAAGLADDDTVSEELGFVEVYTAPAAIQMGTWAMGGYQYEGKLYDAQFAHVEGFDTCIDCHDPHTLELKMEGCAACHQGVDERDELGRIRVAEGSQGNYDGDRKDKEGIVGEIEGLQEMLYEAIQAYAEEAGTPIVYDAHTSYFFVDINGNGEVDEGEATDANQYNAWTGRLLKAAYNYQFSIKNPTAFIHGGKYVIQLLYDSIEDLDAALVEDLVRDDVGHLAGSRKAWRHWDAEGKVDRDCARCHSATGLPTYVTSGASYAEPVSNGMLCATCHPIPAKPMRYVVDKVVFPSKVVVSVDSDNNLCMTCHQGRESSLTIEKMIEGLAPDTVSVDLQLPAVHYDAAGATLFGSEVQGAYQYEGKRYVGRNEHVLAFDSCVECHGGHRLAPDEEQCATCHGRRLGDETTKPQHHASMMECRDCHGMVEVEAIRGHKDYIAPVDYDGDGDIREGHSQEVATLQEALYTAIQAYANDIVGTPIVYDAHSDPHFFTDINGDGAPDPDEINDDNRYRTWTPRLVQAAYNYLYSVEDPGAYAHNGKYIVQILYDSLADIGGNTAGMIRP